VRKLSLSNDSDKFLERLDAKQFKQVVRKILSLASDATPPDSIKLEGSDYRRTDQGEFRIVYKFDADTVYIVLVGKRNDDEVYARAKRKK
jgi:mRNA interferase RelE/StbE